MDFLQIALIGISLLLLFICWKVATPRNDTSLQVEISQLNEKLIQLQGTLITLVETNRNAASDLKTDFKPRFDEFTYYCF
jgi:hypothetical protein